MTCTCGLCPDSRPSLCLFCGLPPGSCTGHEVDVVPLADLIDQVRADLAASFPDRLHRG